mmetsp:Transcript_13423/g.34372  ORF Transcript_13423/g.34372 Transcript_13423/m.34372 type:complete len:248 (-) Transcript_13423:655-1398(-)
MSYRDNVAITLSAYATTFSLGSDKTFRRAGTNSSTCCAITVGTRECSRSNHRSDAMRVATESWSSCSVSTRMMDAMLKASGSAATTAAAAAPPPASTVGSAGCPLAVIIRVAGSQRRMRSIRFSFVAEASSLSLASTEYDTAGSTAPRISDMYGCICSFPMDVKLWSQEIAISLVIRSSAMQNCSTILTMAWKFVTRGESTLRRNSPRRASHIRRISRLGSLRIRKRPSRSVGRYTIMLRSAMASRT